MSSEMKIEESGEYAFAASRGVSAHPLPDWWRRNAIRIKSRLRDDLAVAAEFRPLVDSCMSKGRFLKGSIALRTLEWASLRYDVDEDLLVSLLAQVELVHSAACAIDDVIDGDTVRRGAASFPSRVGTPAAILTSLHMISRALHKEKEILGKALGPLASSFDRMVLGEAYDVISEKYFELNSRWRLAKVLEKTAPLFGAAFWYLGFLSSDRRTEVAESWQLFGEKLGVVYQLSNDFHDVFSIGPLARGEASDLVTLTVSMPLVCAVEMGIHESDSVGVLLSRRELTALFLEWSSKGVESVARQRVNSAIEDCIQSFPVVAPDELRETLDLISSPQFWGYSYHV